MSQKEIADFMEKSRINEPALQKNSGKRSWGLIRTGPAGLFIWRKLKELYPEVDANRVIREGSWDFGYYQGTADRPKNMGRECGSQRSPAGADFSGGLQVFQQEITQLDDDKAVKIFHHCPHVEALQELGLAPEEIKMFCRDMLGHCDYAICAAFPNVDIDFPLPLLTGREAAP